MVLILLVLLASLVCNPTAAAELPSELPASAKAERRISLFRYGLVKRGGQFL